MKKNNMINKKLAKKKITIEDLSLTIKDLSLSMNKGFKRVENLIEKKIDGLAISTAKGFESVDKRFDQHDKIFEVMIKEIKTIHEDNKYFRNSISSLNTDGSSYDRKIEKLTIRVEKLEIK